MKKSEAYEKLQDVMCCLETAVSDGDIEFLEKLKDDAEQCTEDCRRVHEDWADVGIECSELVAELCYMYIDLCEAEYKAKMSLCDSEIEKNKHRAGVLRGKIPVLQKKVQEYLVSI